jgi:hypothetical protein
MADTEDNNFAQPKPEEDSDIIWGVREIAKTINRSASQTYHLISTGALEGTVAKLGHRTFVASRRGLRGLLPQAQVDTATKTRRPERTGAFIIFGARR